MSKIIEETAAVEAAAAKMAELEATLRTAQQDSVRAQALAIALPGRLAAGDQTVTTADLIQAGPAVSIAQAKVAAIGQQLTAAQTVLEQTRAIELVARLRSGEPFISHEQTEKEMARIAAWVTRELSKLARRVEVHNDAFYAVVGSLPKGASHVFPDGAQGECLSIDHGINGKTIDLDGVQFFALPADGWGQDVLSRVEMAEAQARDAAAEPAPRILTWGEILDDEQATAFTAA